MGKKLIAILLSLAMCTIMLPSLSASAGPAMDKETYNNVVAEYASTIEKEYHIDIRYDIRPDGYASIGTATLSTLNTSLGFLSKDFVIELSNYYDSTYGQVLTIEYTDLPSDYAERDIAALGSFSSNKSLIRLFIPTTASNHMTMSGNSPFTILHEFGHAYHVFLMNQIGPNRLAAQWVYYNGSIPYHISEKRNPDKTTFSSLYASASYEEDFAESFAYLFGCNRDGLGISDDLIRKDGSPTALGKKMTYIENSISQYITKPEKALENISKTLNAQKTIEFEDMNLMGNSLEYIGFHQPAGILDNVLLSLKIEATTTTWYDEIGGWKVSDINGGTYLVFPGSGYVTLKIPVRKSKT